MNKKEFLDKIKVELRISKNSDYTIRNYLNANSAALDFSGKLPEEMTEDDVKQFISEKLSDKSSSSIILYISDKSRSCTDDLRKKNYPIYKVCYLLLNPPLVFLLISRTDQWHDFLHNLLADPVDTVRN